jgi:hypothetical protein
MRHARASDRAWKAMRAMRVSCDEELAVLTERQLKRALRLPGVGKGTLAELRDLRAASAAAVAARSVRCPR